LVDQRPVTNLLVSTASGERETQTVDNNFHSVGAKPIGSFTDVDAVVVGLYVDDGHLVPDLHHRQHLTVTEQLVYEVLVIVYDWSQPSLTLVDVVPTQLRCRVTYTTIHTHTHTQPFYGSVDFVWDNPGEPVPEGTFYHLLDFLEQNADNTADTPRRYIHMIVNISNHLPSAKVAPVGLGTKLQQLKQR